MPLAPEAHQIFSFLAQSLHQGTKPEDGVFDCSRAGLQWAVAHINLAWNFCSVDGPCLPAMLWLLFQHRSPTLFISHYI